MKNELRENWQIKEPKGRQEVQENKCEEGMSLVMNNRGQCTRKHCNKNVVHKKQRYRERQMKTAR